MGQKVNPIGFRVTVTKDWRSKWYANKHEFGDCLLEDLKIRSFLKKKLAFAAVTKIVIERAAAKVRITVFTARPGIVIGRKGAEIDRLKDELSKITPREIVLDIEEIKVPDIEAQLVAENIAVQIQRRIPYKRAMRKAVMAAMNAGAKGIKIQTAGRLGGAEIARTERYKEGSIPLHTLRADIDYGFQVAQTTYGTIGVKVWVFRGEKLAN